MGYEDTETAYDLAALNQVIGRQKAMLEVQEWIKQHQNGLIQAELYESLLRLTVPK
jgi:predicted XRE-type DNA-binding protein